jgi:hypothetical protein
VPDRRPFIPGLAEPHEFHVASLFPAHRSYWSRRPWRPHARVASWA